LNRLCELARINVHQPTGAGLIAHFVAPVPLIAVIGAGLTAHPKVYMANY